MANDKWSIVFQMNTHSNRTYTVLAKFLYVIPAKKTWV